MKTHAALHLSKRTFCGLSIDWVKQSNEPLKPAEPFHAGNPIKVSAFNKDVDCLKCWRGVA